MAEKMQRLYYYCTGLDNTTVNTFDETRKLLAIDDNRII